MGRFLESDEYYRTGPPPVLQVHVPANLNAASNAFRNQFETKTSNGALDDGDGTQIFLWLRVPKPKNHVGKILKNFS